MTSSRMETHDYGNAEVNALARAYEAFNSQPQEAWPRMLEWLNARLDADQRTQVMAAARPTPQERT